MEQEKMQKKNFQVLLKEGAINLADFFRPEIEAIVNNQRWRKEYTDTVIKQSIDKWLKCLPENMGGCMAIINALKRQGHLPKLSDMNGFFESDNEKHILHVDVERGAFAARRARIKLREELAQYKSEAGLIFKDRETAAKVLEDIADKAKELLDATEGFVRKRTEEKMKELKSQFQDERKKVEEEIANFSEKLKNLNLDMLVFEVPEFSNAKFELLPETSHDALIGEKTESRVIYKKQSGTWGEIKRMFDVFKARWGYDEEKVDEKYYTLDAQEVENHWNKIVSDALHNLNCKVENGILEPLNESYEKFYDAVQYCFEEVHRVMQKGLDDHSLQEQRLFEVRHELKDIECRLDASVEDVATLKNTSQQLKNHAAPPCNE